ncbi:hypothetical protein Q6279_28840, partial [Klebsiella variicola]|nr:hypothetical protein [Klebsiella variicola]
LNALSVGAVTLKRVREGSDAIVAPYGDLSPTSRTAQAWAKLHSYKPDIVMEGGNFLVDDDEFFCRPSLHHLPITTSKAVGTAP